MELTIKKDYSKSENPEKELKEDLHSFIKEFTESEEYKILTKSYKNV